MRIPNPSVITASAAKLLLGKVVNMTTIGIKQIPCATVRCDRNDFYTYTKMYYLKSTDFLAIDENQLCQLGDIVLIRAISNLKDTQSHYKHLVDQVVFKYGNVIDPVTGKRVLEKEFLDKSLLRNEEWYVFIRIIKLLMDYRRL